MIKKINTNNERKSISFFKRCAFLFCLFLIQFSNAQIFVGEGTILYDNDKVITESSIATTKEKTKDRHFEINNIDVSGRKKAFAKAQKKNTRILATKKEIVLKNIEKKNIVDKSKINILSSAQNKISSEHHYRKNNISSEDNTRTQFVFANSSLYSYIFIRDYIYVGTPSSLVDFTYKDSLDYCCFVRPPPSKFYS